MDRPKKFTFDETDSQTGGRLREALVRAFQDKLGYLPNVSPPTTFNEKILHKMLFDRRQILTTFADKLAVRAYVEQRLGGQEHLTTIYRVFAQADDLYDFTFPSRFVLKATHGSAWNYIHSSGSYFNRVRLISRSRRWLQTNYGQFMGEWCYDGIQPKLFCEEYLGSDDRVPADYKFYCFSGVVRFISVVFDRFPAPKRIAYDRYWNRLDVEWNFPPKLDDAPPPQNLMQMISIAEQLSHGIDFIRVDLYNLKNRVVFGELTNYPDAGRARFSPREWDAKFGSYWRGVDSSEHP